MRPRVIFHFAVSAIYLLGGTASVCSQWTLTTPDDGAGWGDVGENASMAIVNGNPAITYHDTMKDRIRYVRATDASGTAWNTPLEIANNGGGSPVYRTTPLVVVNGNPAIAYYDDNSDDLLYLRANDPDGTSWGSPVTVDPVSGGVGTGRHACMIIVAGRPAIAYQNGSERLTYVRANDANGTSWGTRQILTPSELVRHISLAIINGMPAICYQESISDDIAYIISADAIGTTWSSPIILDALGFNSVYCDLLEVNGYPAVAYGEDTQEQLKFIRALDSTGTSWGSALILDTSFVFMRHISFGIIDGFPAITYSKDGVPTFIRATNADGSAWGGPLTLGPGSALSCSLQIVNGNPAMAYHDDNYPSGSLNYIRSSAIDGSSWPTPAVVDTGEGFVGQYCSLAVILGQPAIAYQGLFTQLKYVRAQDVLGSTWGSPVFIPILGNTLNSDPSLSTIAGNPAIAWSSSTGIRYTRATDSIGSAWGASILLASGSSAYPSMMEINGRPAIAYHDWTAEDLRYIRASDSTGSAWPSSIPLDQTGAVGKWCWMAIVNGRPAVAYLDTNNLLVKYVRAADADGTAWGAPVTVGSGDDYTSLHVANGVPAIAYMSSLLPYYRQAADVDGTSWLPPITVQSTSIGANLSSAVIGGRPVITKLVEPSVQAGLLWATNPAGTSWSSPTYGIPNVINFNNARISVADIASNPGIAYQGEEYTLKYAHLIPTPTPNASRTWAGYE